jgi:hypothetical protein
VCRVALGNGAIDLSAWDSVGMSQTIKSSPRTADRERSASRAPHTQVSCSTTRLQGDVEFESVRLEPTTSAEAPSSLTLIISDT